MTRIMKASGGGRHEKKSALTWSAAGRDCDAMGETTVDAIEHVVLRLAPRAGERFLDIACGTSSAAPWVAARGAAVTGVDIAPRAAPVARAFLPDLRFEGGDAECLPAEDRSFDGIVSVFGVMFTSRPEQAARELARVCRKGGRIGLATWLPGDTVEGICRIMRPYMPAAADPSPSPFEWGRRERLRDLLGASFHLKFEGGVTTLRRPSGKVVWDLFVAGHEPTKSMAAALDADRRRQLQSDFAAFHDAHRTELGVAMPREYLVTIGTRK